jgi:4-hydroxy-tetrahydrodipicolinate reductase
VLGAAGSHGAAAARQRVWSAMITNLTPYNMGALARTDTTRLPWSIVELGLSSIAPQHPPTISQSTDGDRPLDRSVVDRVRATLRRALDRDALPEIPLLCEEEVDRACAPWGRHPGRDRARHPSAERQPAGRPDGVGGVGPRLVDDIGGRRRRHSGIPRDTGAGTAVGAGAAEFAAAGRLPRRNIGVRICLLGLLRTPVNPYAERVPNTYRVVQWNTGNVGKSSLKSIVTNPTLELVGCYAWSPEKAGRDAGELVGIPPLGIAATNDIDELLALKPDCVVYNPMWINVDELVRILSAGVNVVTTASFITGHNLGDGRDRILEACEKGGSTIFGSGVSPGFAELLAIVSAMVCNRIDKVTVNEAADTTFYDSPETEKPVGFGQPIDHPDLPAMAAKGTAIFGEAVRLVGDALGVELDEVKCVAEFAQTTEDLVMASWTIPAGHVAGTYISWQGMVNGKTLIDLNVRWKKGQTLQPDWKIEQDGWVIQVDGQPTVTTKVGFLPPPYFEATTLEEFMDLGHIMTAVPAINGIAAVVAAAPGIATYADLPLTLPRGNAYVGWPGSALT